MTREVETVRAAMTLHQTAPFLADPARSHPSLPVVDEHGRAIGVIDPPSVIRRRRSGHQRSLPLGALRIPERLKVADADEHLDHVADRLSDLNVPTCPSCRATTRPWSATSAGRT
jgi:CBS-domain-containing membrane protein